MIPITCGHTLDDIVGYQVRLTVLDGKVVGPYDGPIVGRFDQASDYGAALALAHEHRIWEESHVTRYALVRLGLRLRAHRRRPGSPHWFRPLIHSA